MDISPIRVLKDAQEAVPAVRYAAGGAGVAAVVAIVAGFQLDARIAVFGTVIVLGLMFVLVVFSALVVNAAARYVPLMAGFASWSFLLLTIGASLLLIVSYFLGLIYLL